MQEKSIVAHLIAPVEFGGGETLLSVLLSQNIKKYFHYIVLIGKSDSFQQVLEKKQIEYLSFSKTKFGFGSGKIKVALKSIKSLVPLLSACSHLLNKPPAILHCHGFPANLVGAIVKSKNKEIKTVLTIHSLLGSHGWVQKKIYKVIYGSYDCITVVSEAVSVSLKQQYPFLDRKIRVIHNCIDERFYSDVKCAPVNKKSVVVVGMVGRLASIKRHDLLIHAFAELVQEGLKDVRLHLIGDGPYRRQLEKIINSYGPLVYNKIKFFGYVDREYIVQAIDELDVVVFPSENEGFGISAVECLARKKRIIAIDSPIFREVLSEFFYPVDQIGLKRKLLSVILEKNLINNSSELFINRYSPEFILQKYEMTYEAI